MNHSNPTKSNSANEVDQRQKNSQYPVEIQKTLHEFNDLKNFFDKQQSQFSDMIFKCQQHKEEYQETFSEYSLESAKIQQEIDNIQFQIDQLKGIQQIKQAEKQKVIDKKENTRQAIQSFDKQIESIKSFYKTGNFSNVSLSSLNDQHQKLLMVYPNKNTKQISQKIAFEQYNSLIFDYLDNHQKIKMQVLNKRFYNQLSPEWNIKIDLRTRPLQGQFSGANFDNKYYIPLNGEIYCLKGKLKQGEIRVAVSWEGQRRNSSYGMIRLELLRDNWVIETQEMFQKKANYEPRTDFNKVNGYCSSLMKQAQIGDQVRWAVISHPTYQNILTIRSFAWSIYYDIEQQEKRPNGLEGFKKIS